MAEKSIQQDTIETPVAGPDAMLMVLAKAFMGDLQSGQVLKRLLHLRPLRVHTSLPLTPDINGGALD
jgi:hypothetical protein